MKKQFGLGFLAAALCFMTACSNGANGNTVASGSQSADASVVSSTSAVESAPAVESTPVTPQAAESAAGASTSAAASASAETPDESGSASAQEPTETNGKPLLTGSFASTVKIKEKPQTDGDSYVLHMTADSGTIVIARFATNHATEALMDDYAPGDVEVIGEVTVDGNRGTHYGWTSGSKKDAMVVNAVVTEADGYSLLFLCQAPKDAYEGKTDLGPTEKQVNEWIDSLSVTKEK